MRNSVLPGSGGAVADTGSGLRVQPDVLKAEFFTIIGMEESAQSTNQQRYNPAEIEPKWQARRDADPALYAAE